MSEPKDPFDQIEERLRQDREAREALGKKIQEQDDKTRKPEWRPDHADDGGVI
jgi:hypothetical protein